MKLLVVKRITALLSATCLSISLFSASLHAADNDLPDLGAAALSTLTFEKELILGDLFMRQARAGLPVSYDPLLDEYITTLGSRLVANADDVNFPFKFFIVQDKSVNAFAFFGGHVGINSGLIAMADTESELASVLSHEIAHVTQRHLSRRIEAQQRNAPASIAGFLAGVLLALADPQAGIATIMSTRAASAQAQINFTRGNEQEADRIGMKTLAAAGFDPRASASFFEKLADATRHVSKLPQFLLTHPLPTSRISDARLRAQQYRPKYINESRDFYLAKARIFARFVHESADAVKQLEQAKRGERGILKDARMYGLALAYSDNKQLDKAEKTLRPLLAKEPNNLFYIDTMSDILGRQKRFKEALTMLAKQYDLRPNNQVVTLNYADIALKSGDSKTAKQLLHYFLLKHPQHFLATDLLAQIYKKDANMAKYYETKAELYALMSLYDRSIVQLNKALEHVTSEQALDIQRMEARIKQFRVRMKQMKG